MERNGSNRFADPPFRIFLGIQPGTAPKFRIGKYSKQPMSKGVEVVCLPEPKPTFPALEVSFNAVQSRELWPVQFPASPPRFVLGLFVGSLYMLSARLLFFSTHVWAQFKPGHCHDISSIWIAPELFFTSNLPFAEPAGNIRIFLGSQANPSLWKLSSDYMITDRD